MMSVSVSPPIPMLRSGLPLSVRERLVLVVPLTQQSLFISLALGGVKVFVGGTYSERLFPPFYCWSIGL